MYWVFVYAVILCAPVYYDHAIKWNAKHLLSSQVKWDKGQL